MNDKPNSTDFSVNEKPREYQVCITIKCRMLITVFADSQDDAEAQAEKAADDVADGTLGIEPDEISDVSVNYTRKTAPMYRVTRGGREMQVSRLKAGDLPREPDERGF